LSEVAWAGRPEVLEVADAAQIIDSALGKAEGFLWVRCDFVEVPANRVEAKLI
jgi:hypothetical protein